MITFSRRMQPIPHVPNYYISGVGKLYRIQNGEFEAAPFWISSNGYAKFDARGNDGQWHTYTVTDAVLYSFGGYCDTEWECNMHLDGNRLNNCISNLKKGTYAENNKMTHVHNPNTTKGDKSSRAKLAGTDIPFIKGLYRQGYIIKEIAEMYGVTSTAIHYVVFNKTWKHIS